MTERICVVCCCLASIVSCTGEQRILEKKMPSERVFVESRFIKVGIDLRLGGAVTHVSEPGGPNLINSYDLGRQIQQSYYSGPPNYKKEGKQKSPAWKSFPWNPIQSGDAYYNGSKVLDHHVRDGKLYVKTVPMLWPMNNDSAECVMETWIRPLADAPGFEYRARLTNARSDSNQYGAYNQEVPAIYVNGPWHRLMTYTGDNPFSGEPAVEVRNDHREPWPWVHFVATEGWSALISDDGSGIGVCCPEVKEFHGGFSGRRGSGGEKSANTGYMSPITSEILDHNIVYEYSCTMLLGTIEQIRARARRVILKALPSWKFGHSRQGWHCLNGRDAGWPMEFGGLKMKSDDITRQLRLIGPFTFWRAETAGQVALLVSSNAAVTIKVFWRGMPPWAVAKNSDWALWKKKWWENKRSCNAKIPEGTRKWVTVRLAGLPAYTGGMTGLAIDVPDGVTIHEVRLTAVDGNIIDLNEGPINENN